jgi:hypothetical protein
MHFVLTFLNKVRTTVLAPEKLGTALCGRVRLRRFPQISQRDINTVALYTFVRQIYRHLAVLLLVMIKTG